MSQIMKYFESFCGTAISFGNWHFPLTNHQWQEAVRVLVRFPQPTPSRWKSGGEPIYESLCPKIRNLYQKILLILLLREGVCDRWETELRRIHPIGILRLLALSARKCCSYPKSVACAQKVHFHLFGFFELFTSCLCLNSYRMYFVYTMQSNILFLYFRDFTMCLWICLNFHLRWRDARLHYFVILSVYL